MEYLCKNAKNANPLSITLGDISMRLVSPGKDEVVYYSAVRSAQINKNLDGYYSITLKTLDKATYVISNRYCYTTGKVNDKSPSYGLFVRLLHRHLREKSKAEFCCVKNFRIPDWQKTVIMLLLFGSSFLLDSLGFSLFHPVFHGLALSIIGLVVMMLAERNRSVEWQTRGEIPVEFLPFDQLHMG